MDTGKSTLFIDNQQEAKQKQINVTMLNSNDHKIDMSV